MQEKYTILKFENLSSEKTDDEFGLESFTASHHDSGTPDLSGEALVSRISRAEEDVAPKLESAVLSAAEAEEERKKPDQLVVPEAMPLTLADPEITTPEIETLNEKALGDTEDYGVTWGVQQVLGENPDTSISGEGVTVAVLDTGIDEDHPVFEDIKDTLVQKDFVKDADGSAPDENGHGTHCAGTIFGRDFEGQRIGVAPGVKNVVIGRVLDKNGRGNINQLLKAMNWLYSQKVNIVSMSLGFDFPRLFDHYLKMDLPPKFAATKALKAYREAIDAFGVLCAALTTPNHINRGGTLIVAASGNDSRRNVDEDLVIDVSVPANTSKEIVSVGALKQSSGSLDIAHFSNINPIVAAPGVGIVSAAHKGALRPDSGTSMACPHVAGTAALWWEWMNKKDGQANAALVKSKLVGSATSEQITAGFVDRGAGIPVGPQV